MTGLDGAEDWVLVHVEVQGANKPDFAQRMFAYNYRLFRALASDSAKIFAETWC